MLVQDLGEKAVASLGLLILQTIQIYCRVEKV
jgi:hypothetical protein